MTEVEHAPCDHCPTRDAQVLCDACGDLLCLGCAVPTPMSRGGRRRVLCGTCFGLYAAGHAIPIVTAVPGARSGHEWPLVLAGLSLMAAPFGLYHSAVSFGAFLATHLLAVPAFVGGVVQLDRIARGLRSEAPLPTVWLAIGVSVLSMIGVSFGTWFGVMLRLLS